PAPRPLFAPMPAPSPSVASRALSAEEWSLVATFPSAATAVQMVAARQAAEWTELASVVRAAAVGPQTLLTAGPDGPRPERAAEPTARPATAARGEWTARAAAAAAETPMIGARAARLAPVQMSGGETARVDEPRITAAAARGGAPREYVAPSLPAVPTTQAFEVGPARLPGGRTPRGSFTWPKL